MNEMDLPLFASTLSERSKLEKAFWDFHDKHPSVYNKLVELARLWVERKGVAHLGIATLYEAARWTLAIQERDDCGLKLNNNHRAYYARLIMDTESDLGEFFKLRKQRRPATFGPDNDSLEEREHLS